jgi:uncharacterized cupin superfamily protein
MTEKTKRHPNVVNVSEVESSSHEKGVRFSCLGRHLGYFSGGKGIGCSWYEVPPGKVAWPYHYHTANEESLYVLEGTGTLRIGKEEVAVGPGDYASFPVGPDHAHQLINTGTTPLRYLCFSTMLPVEVVGYPDSDKIGAAAWKTDMSGAVVRAMRKRADGDVDYWDGEPIDEPVK